MKEAFVKFNFIDMDGLKPITKIVVSHSTAEGIFTALKGTLEQLEKELSRKPSKKEKKTEIKKEEKKEEKNEEKEERSYVRWKMGQIPLNFYCVNCGKKFIEQKIF